MLMSSLSARLGRILGIHFFFIAIRDINLNSQDSHRVLEANSFIVDQHQGAPCKKVN